MRWEADRACRCWVQMVEKERRTGNVYIEQDGRQGLWHLLGQPLRVGFAVAVFALLLGAPLCPHACGRTSWLCGLTASLGSPWRAGVA